ncbi:MAG: DUF4249 domain-containing protein [Sphingobacteriaceae bacterium]|nr:DUF4249 domain-containing protein [Cytophagaceae bacterium]
MKWSTVSAVFFLTGVAACVEPYVPNLNLEGQRFTVEATITDLPEPQYVKLSYAVAKPFNEFEITAVGLATVTVLANGVALVWKETTPGHYEAPVEFRGTVGTRYQLRLALANGQRYESTEEIMPAVPPIANVYDRFNSQGIARSTDRSVFWPSNDVYVDVQDPTNERNFYRWDWTLWEKQQWCSSVRFGGSIGFYDYECRSKCWDLIFNETSSLLSDTYSNGRTITGQLVGHIPYYSMPGPTAMGALVEVRQYGITPGAYRYQKLLQDQSEKTGGLADTPPAPLIGNVRNTGDDTEIVTGYFTASAVSKRRYWLDRKNATTPPIGFFQAFHEGRGPNPEPFSPGPPCCRPPTVPCFASATRTPDQPEGWQGF